MSARRTGLVLLAAILWLAPAAAEQVRVESVGAAPILDEGTVPREEAVRAAVAAAVLEVARRQLPDDFVPPGLGGRDDPDPDTWLEERLEDPFAYAMRFGIVEDRGRRPAMFAEGPGVDFEYVVVVDVTLDADAIRERLQGLGLLAAGAPARAGRRLVFELEGLTHYQPLALLRRALEAERGVRSTLPVEFQRGRVVLEVDADRDVRGLVDALQGRVPDGLQVVPLQVGAERATLLVDWKPPAVPAAASDGPPDGDD